jgi:uncharacterized hydrophobic protein (TIGR00271 family)
METSLSDGPGRREKLDLPRLFDLRRDQADPQQIDEAVRAGVRVAGTNLWVLFFAILTASVGLNVNSAATIIGAMLISPLMGPIIGIGYAAGVSDFGLIRQAFRNLAIFTAVSFATSALYFALSPLNEVGSELLARTSPTVWDVLIAFFGGAAGVIALTRRSISNVVPGVAIATALMPPLCTAGFGLAHGRWDMLAGALFLFVINGVFIATATLLVVKGLRLPLREDVPPAVHVRTRRIIALGLVAVLGPSVYLGWRLVQDEVFLHGARQVVSALKGDERFVVVEAVPDARGRALQLTVLADRSDPSLQANARALMDREGLSGARLDLRYASEARQQPQAAARRDDPRDDYARILSQQLRDRDSRIKTLEERLKGRDAADQLAASLQAEIRAQVPQVSAVTLAQGRADPAAADKGSAFVVVLHTSQKLPRGDIDRLQKWLAVRLSAPEVLVMELSTPAAQRRKA